MKHLLCAFLLGVATAAERPSLWLWLFQDVDRSLQQALTHRSIVSAVGITGFGMDAHGQMQSEPNATVVRTLVGAGIEVHGLCAINSMATLRLLSADAERVFFADAIAAALRNNISGYNMDFEPYAEATTLTNADGLLYASFLHRFALALHKTGRLVLTVDTFTNLPMWNLAAINGTAVDRVITMDTYVQENRTFEAYAAVASAYVAPTRLGIGMCAAISTSRSPYGPDPCPAEAWSDEQLAERFAWLQSHAHRYSQINVWVLPLPDNWWAALTKFVSRRDVYGS